MFETRVKALNDLRRNLKDEGWYYDKSCPGNKRKIRNLAGKKDYAYLSPNMDIIPSMKGLELLLQRRLKILNLR